MGPDPDIIEGMLKKLARPGFDLASYAAEDAVMTLLENWKPALDDGAGLQGFVSDVDSAIEHLLAFRNRIIAIYPEAHPR